MAVQGVFSSDASIAGDRKQDFPGTYLRTYPTGSAPLFALSSGMKEKKAHSAIVSWFEKQDSTDRTKINTMPAGPTGATLIVDDASWFTAGSIFLVENTGEHIYVTGTSGNTVTVVRGFASTAVSNIVIGGGVVYTLQKISVAFEEGSDRPAEIHEQGYPVTNYTQIFRHSWGLTGTAEATAYNTGPKMAETKETCMHNHAIDIERALWWGRYSFGNKNNQPFRTMNGVLAQINTNTFTAGAGTISRLQLNQFMEAVFSKNVEGAPNERLAFCGSGVVLALNEIVANETMYTVTTSQTEYGLKVIKWITPFGELSFMTHPLMNQSPIWRHQLYVLHPAQIYIHYLRRSHYDNMTESGQMNGVDAKRGTVTAELSLELNLEICAATYSNIQEAAI